MSKKVICIKSFDIDFTAHSSYHYAFKIGKSYISYNDGNIINDEPVITIYNSTETRQFSFYLTEIDNKHRLWPVFKKYFKYEIIDKLNYLIE